MKRRALWAAAVFIFAAPALGADGMATSVTLAEVESPVRPGEMFTVTVSYVFPETTYQIYNSEFFTIEIAGDDIELVVEDIRYPEGIEYEDAVIYRGAIDVELDVALLDAPAAGEYVLTATAGYQLCEDGGVCFFPQIVELPVVICIEESNADILETPDKQ